MIRIRRVDISAIDFSSFVHSSVFWLGAGPMWVGKIRGPEGETTRFLHRLTLAAYDELLRHHLSAHDRRLHATPPPPREWWDEGIRKGMFVRMPVMPSAAMFEKYKDVRKPVTRAKAA